MCWVPFFTSRESETIMVVYQEGTDLDESNLKLVTRETVINVLCASLSCASYNLYLFTSAFYACNFQHSSPMLHLSQLGLKCDSTIY